MKHGLDADHLATIDGLTRHNAHTQRPLGRYCGTLFSLGHGAVVLVVALATAALARDWRPPAWLEMSGAAVSIAFLFGIAFLNLSALATAVPGKLVAPVGLKSRFLGRFLVLRSGWAILAVGALFALSFDTISQAALFAVAANRFGGAVQALLIALLFVAGMLVVDGCNGFWISGMIRRADRTAAIASRILAVTITALSGGLGLFTLARLLLPPFSAWVEGSELLFSAAIIVAVVVAFGVGMLAARNRKARGDVHASEEATETATA